MENSFIQKFFKAILPQKLVDDIEAESRSWVLQCPDCKHERSYWELGDIRWKAAGNPRKYRRCPNCGNITWHMGFRKTV